MNSYKTPLLILGLLGLGACAHGPSVERQQAYFECPRVPMEVAQANMQTAGYQLGKSEDPTHAETGWTEYKIEQDGTKQTLKFRLKADTSKSGLRFSIWAPTADEGEMAWTGVTERQIKEDTYRALLNKIRRDICGGKADFFEAP